MGGLKRNEQYLKSDAYEKQKQERETSSKSSIRFFVFLCKVHCTHSFSTKHHPFFAKHPSQSIPSSITHPHQPIKHHSTNHIDPNESSITPPSKSLTPSHQSLPRSLSPNITPRSSSASITLTNKSSITPPRQNQQHWFLTKHH